MYISGPRMKIITWLFHERPKLLGVQISQGPNFLGPKFLGDQKIQGPKWDWGPFQFSSYLLIFMQSKSIIYIEIMCAYIRSKTIWKVYFLLNQEYISLIIFDCTFLNFDDFTYFDLWKKGFYKVIHTVWLVSLSEQAAKGCRKWVEKFCLRCPCLELEN